MSATTPTDPHPPHQQTKMDRAVWPMLILLLALMALMIGAGLLYVSVRNPALARALTVATGGVTLLGALVTLVLNLPRR